MAFWDRNPRQKFETDERLTVRGQVQDDPGIQVSRKQAKEAEARAIYARIQLRNIEKFKAQYPSIPIQQIQNEPKAQASSSSQQGALWGFGYPRGAGAKWPGGMATPYAGIAINHWQLRQQARDTSFDAPHAQALINRFADSTVDTGLKLEPTPRFDILGISPEEAEEWAQSTRENWELWCRNKNQNRSRTMNWYQAQHLLAKEVERDNDEFVRLYYSQDPGLLNPLQFEVLDANMIRGDAFTVTNIIGKFPDGIERNPDGSEKAYKIWAQGYDNDANTYNFHNVTVPRIGEKSGRLFMLHGFKADYAGQGRGFAGIGAIVQELEIIEDILLSVSKRAINQSNIAMFVKPSQNAPASNPFEFMLQNAAGPAPFALGVPGTTGSVAGGVPITTNPVTYTPLKEATVAVPGSTGVYTLQEGEDLVLPSAGSQDPQLKEFVLMILGIISASRGMPLDELMMTYDSSYSASRMTRLAFEKILNIKRQDHDDNFETPMYEMWLTGEIAAGRIACPGWEDPQLRAAWTSHTLNGPTMPDIDPEKTANANKANLAMGATNLDLVARTTNGSSAAHNRQRNKAAVEELITWPWEIKITEQLTPSGQETETQINSKAPGQLVRKK